MGERVDFREGVGWWDGDGAGHLSERDPRWDAVYLSIFYSMVAIKLVF